MIELFDLLMQPSHLVFVSLSDSDCPSFSGYTSLSLSPLFIFVLEACPRRKQEGRG